jgi:peptide/nickel transport system substrate-binding protein
MRWTASIPVIACALLGCGPSADRPLRTWSIAVAALPGPLSGAFATAADDVNLAALIGQSPTTVRVVEGVASVTPGLLSAWAWSEDGRRLTGTIRADATWQDGTPVDAEDVAQTFALLLNPDARSPRRALFDDLEGPPRALDPHTVEWTYRSAGVAEARLAALSAIPPLPRARLTAITPEDAASHPDVQRPLASGAFRIDLDTPEGLRLVARARSSTNVEAVLVRTLPDAVARREAFLAGELDVLHGMTREDLRALDGQPGVQFVDRGPRTMEAIAFNVDDPLLTDPAVRRALRATADVARWAEALVDAPSSTPLAQPARAPFPPWQVPPPPTFPVAAPTAGAQLDALGWTRRGPDAPRTRGGEPLRLGLLVNAENVRRMQVAAAWQIDLAALGVALNIEAVPLAAFKERMANGSFQIAFHGFGAPIVAQPGPAWRSPTASAARGANVSGLHDANVDAAIDAWSTAEPSARGDALADVARRVDEAAAFVPLWWLHEWVALGPRVGDALPDVVSPWTQLDAWTYRGEP